MVDICTIVIMHVFILNDCAVCLAGYQGVTEGTYLYWKWWIHPIGYLSDLAPENMIFEAFGDGVVMNFNMNISKMFNVQTKLLLTQY